MNFKKTAVGKWMLIFAAALAAMLLTASCGKEHSHTIEFVSPKAATCSEEGNIGYWICSECGGYFSDANGKKPIEDKDSVIIPIAQHTYGDRLSYDENSHFYLCITCGNRKDEAAHTFDDLFICTGCGYTHYFEGFTFARADGGVIITGTNLQGSIVIPAFYRDVPILGIAESAFKNNKDITEVTVSEGITEIGASAFEGCINLRNVVIAESVSVIGEKAFSYSGLDSLILPGGIVELGNEAFSGCTSLKILVICEGIESIGEAVFRDCAALEQIVFPESLKKIGVSAFRGCSSLREIVLPKLLEEIGDYAFAASGLETLVLDGTGLKIGVSAFRDCLWLEHVTLGNGVASVGESTFSGCMGLGSVTIKSGVSEIGNSAFRGCSALKSLVIPESVVKIGFGAFSGCSSLAEITLPFIGSEVNSTENDAHFGYIFGAGTYNDNESNIPKTLKKVTVTSGEAINASAFRECRYLTEVVVSAAVDVIGGNAFSGCTSLVKVTVPGSVTAIGYGAFANCSALAEIAFGGSAAEWEAVAKGLTWNENAGNFKVSCTDSVIEKETV